MTRIKLYGLKTVYKPGHKYKIAELIIMEISWASERQFSLFSKENPRHQLLIDRINKTENEKEKFFGMDHGRIWMIKQERLSYRYTSKSVEIIKVKSFLNIDWLNIYYNPYWHLISKVLSTGCNDIYWWLIFTPNFNLYENKNVGLQV